MSHDTKPNILLILTDQHRLSAMGCYGDTPCQTPHLDRLAREGIRFETAYTCYPVCSPARAAILTGHYPHKNGVSSNCHNLGCSIHELADRPQLLSRQMRSAGYHCGYTGKWHLGTDNHETFGGSNTPSLPKDVGFDGQNFPGHGGGGFDFPEYKDYLEKQGLTHHVIGVNDKNPGMPYGILTGPTESTVPYFLTENTIDLIDTYRQTNEPFFIWHNYWGPHSPYYAPQKYYDQYKDVEIPQWENYHWDSRGTNGPHQVKIHPRHETMPWDEWAQAIRHYYAFTTLIDEQVGRLMKHLDDTGVRDNTIVIFTADHGETLGSHGGLTDKGFHHFEEIQRIPFIIWMPKRYQNTYYSPGSVKKEWLSNIDLFPTILDFAGVDPELLGVHGRSIRPLLEQTSHTWRDYVVIEFTGLNNVPATMLTLRKGNLKYGWNCTSWDELYDLETDPFEMNNQIDNPEYAQSLQAMRLLLLQWMQQTDHPSLLLYQQGRLYATSC